MRLVCFQTNGKEGWQSNSLCQPPLLAVSCLINEWSTNNYEQNEKNDNESKASHTMTTIRPIMTLTHIWHLLDGRIGIGWKDALNPIPVYSIWKLMELDWTNIDTFRPYFTMNEKFQLVGQNSFANLLWKLYTHLAGAIGSCLDAFNQCIPYALFLKNTNTSFCRAAWASYIHS